MSCDQKHLGQDQNTCGCCEGKTVSTPVELQNRAGLSAIAYRVGTQTRFKDTMLTRLTSKDYPPLQRFKTRDDADFSIALLDAWAVVADVLTFYQERIANESYLRTATEQKSLNELARLLGYKPRPGVAANTYLVFTVEKTPGGTGASVIDVGVKVQSVPAPNEKPQTFETVEKIEARQEWNAITPQPVSKSQQTQVLSVLQNLFSPDANGNQNNVIALKGTSTKLSKGDMILIVTPAQSTNKLIACKVGEVTIDNDSKVTNIVLDPPLATQGNNKGGSEFKIFAMRKRASLFGYNAPDWSALPEDTRTNYDKSILTTSPPPDSNDWILYPNCFPQINSLPIVLYLDSVYKEINVNDYLILSNINAHMADGSLLENINIIGQVGTPIQEVGISWYAISGQVSNIQFNPMGKNTPSPDTGDMNYLRQVSVYINPEELELADIPVSSSNSQTSTGLSLANGALPPFETTQIDIDPSLNLTEGRTIIVTGKRMRIKIVGDISSLSTGITSWLILGDSLPLMQPPQIQPGNQIECSVMARDGSTQSIILPIDVVQLESALADDESVSEVSTIEDVDPTSWQIILHNSLTNYFDRSTMVINANVALATHGETVQEILGNGDATQEFQEFLLKQSPLTYTSAQTPNGTESSLHMYVNDVEWHEKPMLYGAGKKDRIFITRQDVTGATTVEFGDGQTGARVQTGNANIRALYRKGVGTVGNLKAGQLTLLMSRPLGVKNVTNLIDATGGDDPESLERTRTCVPLSVMTLGRIVSLQDYEDYARAFAGIAKSLATWTWDGEVRGVFITISGPDGITYDSDSVTVKNLIASMYANGDPYVPLRVQSYTESTFTISALVKIDPDYITDDVVAKITDMLRAQFSFDLREFGQGVTLGEVMATIQGVAGVIAVDITKLYRIGYPPAMNSRLLAAVPQAGEDGNISPAELLTIDPGPINLEIMP